ncbi:MAG: DNA recombination protein RmuC [Paludibacteraceae bacterium]|nr:DNA recombination protein RmuC [Candidatus Colicola coprequi]MCQ2333193.1 DNA recombination protein RmuC [Paludibacteraceae bacterium]
METIILIVFLVLAVVAVVFITITQRKHYSEMLRMQNESHEAALQSQKAVFNEQIALLKEEVKTSTAEVLRVRQEELKSTNREEVGKIIDPLHKEIERMERLLAENKEGNDKNTSSLEGQIRAMMMQSDKLGREANNLAEAMKHRGKVHGDFSEMVLEEILENSGLQRNFQFFTQQSYKGEHGNELRPDVVVKCPGQDGGEGVIIVDSKCSLTAWSDYVGAETDEQREEAKRRNLLSVKQHIKELADKNYTKYVPSAMKYALMFIPNEGAYVLALNSDNMLNQEAFRQGVILVNPTSLMMVLFLVWQSWQSTHQEDNCRAILEAAADMCDKMTGVVDTFTTLGNQFDTATRTYERAMGQLSEGRGNLLGKMESLKSLGVVATKRAKVKRLKRSEIEEEVN